MSISNESRGGNGRAVPLAAVAVTVAAYALNFLYDTDAVKQQLHAPSPFAAAARSLTETAAKLDAQVREMSAVVHARGAQYENLLQIEQRDAAILSEVNNQLTAAGLPPVRTAGNPPLVAGFRAASPPPVQAVTGAS